MKRVKTTLGLALAGLIGWAALGGPKAEYRCSLTGSTIEQCCCVLKEGRLYCPLAEQAVEKCCCEKVNS